MHELNAFEEFEPARGTKSIWLFTRKKSSNYRGLKLPGLFQTEHAAIDVSGFVLVIILELWGLQNLLIVGDIAFTYVAGLFLGDIVFAVLRHLPQGRLCEDQNRLVVSNDHLTTARLEAIVRRRKILPHVFSLLIIVIAAAKIFGFFALQGGEFTGLTLAIGLSYGICALLHIAVTGNLLYALATSILLWKDRRKYLGSEPRKLVPRVFTFSSSAHLIEGRVDRHHLYPQENSSGTDPTWVIKTTGVLTDSQLGALVNSQQEAAACHAVARAGVEHQLQILQAEPQYQGAST